MLKSSRTPIPYARASSSSCSFIAVSSIVDLLLRFSTLEKEKRRFASTKLTGQLQIEQERSEKLLLNILPGSIAERLRTVRKRLLMVLPTSP